MNDLILADVNIEEIMPLLGWVSAFVGMVATSFVLPILKKSWQEKAKAEVVLGPQPFEVRMKEEFVTRREFEKFEARMEVSVEEMKGLFKQTMMNLETRDANLAERMERRDKQLQARIDQFGTSAYDGRRKLWDQVNEQRETLAAVKQSTDVVGQIDRLVDAMTPALEAAKPRTTRKS